jgi:hypothetical protein
MSMSGITVAFPNNCTHAWLNIKDSSEKCVIRQFCHDASITEYTYTNLDGIA